MPYEIPASMHYGPRTLTGAWLRKMFRMVEVRKLLTAITRPFKTERFKPTFIRRSYSWKAKIYLQQRNW